MQASKQPIDTQGVAPNVLKSQRAHLYTSMLAAYRWQDILSGAKEPRFIDLLRSMIGEYQAERIHGAFAPLMEQQKKFGRRNKSAATLFTSARQERSSLLRSTGPTQ